jgi:hypothetical protein
MAALGQIQNRYIDKTSAAGPKWDRKNAGNLSAALEPAPVRDMTVAGAVSK